MIHEGLIYTSESELSRVVAPFLREGVAAGEPAIVILPRDRQETIRSALGDAAAGISFIELERWYGRPGHALLAWIAVVEDALAAGAERIRAVGEPPLASDGHRLERWRRYESQAERLLQDAPIWLICPYDASRVSEGALQACRATHPMLVTDEGRVSSPDYFREASAPVFAVAAELRTPTTDAMSVSPDDLPALRRAVVWPAREAGVRLEDAQDLALAVAELARGAFALSAEPVMLRTGGTGAEWSCEVLVPGAPAHTLAAHDGRVALAIGSVVAKRIELGDRTDGGLVRFVIEHDTPTPRERILAAACELFAGEGVAPTTVNAIAARAGVAKATLYALFPSKDDLVLECIRTVAREWQQGVPAEVEARGTTPRQRLEQFCDVVGEGLAHPVATGAPLLRVAIDVQPPDHPARTVLAAASGEVLAYLTDTARAAGAPDPPLLASQLYMLGITLAAVPVALEQGEAVRVASSAARTLIGSALAATDR